MRKHSTKTIRQRRRIALSALVLFVAASGVARADQIDDFIRTEMQKQHLPGLSLAVVKDGKIVKVEGYGLADVKQKIPARPETIFKIGSVSKQFIATGIMLLVQDGQLRLEDPVNKYLDGAPPAWKDITIRHLLTHTSGLVREAPGFDPFKIQSDADVIRTAYPLPLRFTPGEKWEYCNVGYFALAEIIHQVSGRPWTDFLEERVFKPSGMTTTRPTNTKERLPNRALGYAGDDNRKEADDWTALRPSGAFLSSVLDLAKWDAMLATDKVLTESSRREMWTPVRLNDGKTHPYGFGWELGSLKDHRLVQHGGSLPGFRSQFARFVDDRVSVIVLTNAEDVDRGSIVSRIAKFYLPVAVGGPPREMG
jgi:CubicO group peptidase (beta-lactamase class C family)